jgi:hypothetical protein
MKKEYTYLVLCILLLRDTSAATCPTRESEEEEGGAGGAVLVCAPLQQPRRGRRLHLKVAERCIRKMRRAPDGRPCGGRGAGQTNPPPSLSPPPGNLAPGTVVVTSSHEDAS